MEQEGDDVSKPQKLTYSQNTKGEGVLLISNFFFAPLGNFSFTYLLTCVKSSICYIKRHS